MMDCKRALTDAGGDAEKAIELLRVKQGKRIQDLGERTATEGTVQTYIHATARVGVLVEVDCNTDFVAAQRRLRRLRSRRRAPDRRRAAVRYVSREDVPEDVARPRRASPSSRPPTSPRTSASGSPRASSLEWYSDRPARPARCTTRQAEGASLQQFRAQLAATTGENVVIRRSRASRWASSPWTGAGASSVARVQKHTTLLRPCPAWSTTSSHGVSGSALQPCPTPRSSASC